MAYIKKESTTEKLKQRFIDKNSDKWADYDFVGPYYNKETKALFRHKVCGNEFMMTPGNFSSGHGCPKCARKIVAEKLFEQKGSKFLDLVNNSNGEYTMLSEYKGSNTKVVLRHNKCGAIFTRTPGSVNLSGFNGCLCSVCNKKNVADSLRFTVEQANEKLAKVNKEYEFITYNGAINEATIRHKVCGHEFTGKASYFILGDGHCPRCTTNISKQEREIFEWVKSICPDTLPSVRNIEGVSEIDIYVPSKKVGIEYNGHYWHSAQKLMGKERMTYAEAKKYHRNKSLACEKQGIRLIHIWDYEWDDERKQKVLKNIILGALGMLTERYYARDCKVCRYDNTSNRWDELNNFFKENNIQGNRGGTLVYTLEKDDKILMAYKFGKPSGGKAKLKYRYEMVRGASAPGVQVIGGATRLWKHFIKDESPDSVVYYIDYNYFDGRSVEKIGLKCVGGEPGVKNYFVDEKVVKNRQPSRHAEIRQMIRENKVLELWNAGTKVYVYNK